MNEKKYNDIFIELFNVKKEELNDNFTFDNIDKWDSFLHMQLISRLEDIFDIMLETEDIIHYASYNNGKKILNKYGIEF